MYIPISRRYRPQDFDSVAGQQHITQILKNAILMNKAGYAYLFSGPQGVGKTSTARVFAKSLNCEERPYGQSLQ
jgi:DNA polymerase-3 subunit gamma/tau